MSDGPLPPWISNVPLKTVAVLCATTIFGKNVEARYILLAGKRYFHNTLENVVQYALNPILPPLDSFSKVEAARNPEAALALMNIRDCFNYIFHIQVDYFKILAKLMPDRLRSDKSGTILHLNQFAAMSPTLENSKRRYLVLSRIDGVQPYDLDLDWDAEFDWIEKSFEDTFTERLSVAQDAYIAALRLGEWYSSRERTLIIPLKTIMTDLTVYFDNLSQAAYTMAVNSKRPSEDNIQLIKRRLIITCLRLERFALDMMRVNVATVVKHDMDRLDGDCVEEAIRIRAEDDFRGSNTDFHRHRDGYTRLLDRLYKQIGFKSDGSRRMTSGTGAKIWGADTVTLQPRDSARLHDSYQRED